VQQVSATMTLAAGCTAAGVGRQAPGVSGQRRPPSQCDVATVLCPAGRTIVSGGYHLGDEALAVLASFPLQTAQGQGWAIVAQNDDHSAAHDLEVDALCTR
jgi:hypothetical protein